MSGALSFESTETNYLFYLFRRSNYSGTGHLKGLSATTYPTAYKALRNYGVEVIEDSHLVTHGNIGTAAGCLAAVNLVSWAIEKMYDDKIREDIIASVLPVGQGQVCIYL